MLETQILPRHMLSSFLSLSKAQLLGGHILSPVNQIQLTNEINKWKKVFLVFLFHVLSISFIVFLICSDVTL